MSYDLHLFRPQPDAEPRAVVEAHLSRGDGQVLRRLLASPQPAARREAEAVKRHVRQVTPGGGATPPADGAAPTAAGDADAGGSTTASRPCLEALASTLRGLCPALVTTVSPEQPRVRRTGVPGRLQLSHPQTGVQLTLEAEHVALSIPFSHGDAAARAVLEEVARWVVALEKAGGFQTYDPQIQAVLRLPDELAGLVTRYAGSADTLMSPTLPKRKPRWKFW